MKSLNSVCYIINTSHQRKSVHSLIAAVFALQLLANDVSLVSYILSKESHMTPCLLVHQETQKARQFLPFLQRAGRSEAVVEYVFSGSRLKLYLPKDTCLITFLLAGR